MAAFKPRATFAGSFPMEDFWKVPDSSGSPPCNSSRTCLERSLDSSEVWGFARLASVND